MRKSELEVGTRRRGRVARVKEFPLVEVFGHSWDAGTPSALHAFSERYCPFSQMACEKHKQYGFAYCSVSYAAADDGGVARTYAVCDHRLDGAPLAHAIKDHFGTEDYVLVPEVVLTNPRTSFDYVALGKGNDQNVIAIETQAIDIRGGGVGPAWEAWLNKEPDAWREYFTRSADSRQRKDVVAYGVNMANIYKRLGLQVAVKGSFLKGLGVPFYVLMQDRTFSYLANRIRFAEATDNWDISFVTFDYTNKVDASGQHEFVHVRTIRTTVASYIAAMSADERMASAARADFLERVKRKAGLLDIQLILFRYLRS